MSAASAVLSPLNPELGWPSYQQVEVERWQGATKSILDDAIAEEVPVSLVYNGTPHVVMLATPTNLEDFALGFSLTEGIIASPSELLSTHIYNRSNGIEVRLAIPEQRFCGLADKGRNLTGRTGCGLCGATTLEQAVRPAGAVRQKICLPVEELTAAFAQMSALQQLNRLTGAVHAAGWAKPGSRLKHVREDVGRHNALDKLIGLLYRLGEEPSEGYVVITSRASYEVVQKAAITGIGLLAAISAPTGLAVRLAKEAGVTLVGFTRGDQHVVYAHPEHLNHSHINR